MIVNGTVNAAGATFASSNSNGNVVVNTGGRLLASGSAFNLPLYLPAANVASLSSAAHGGTGADNLKFQNIYITSDVAAGGTLNLNLIGTQSTTNLQYLFDRNATVNSGATLNVGAGVSLTQVSAYNGTRTLTVNGTLNFASGSSIFLDASQYGSLTQLIVNGTVNATGATFASNASGGSVVVNTGGAQSGGKLIADGVTFQSVSVYFSGSNATETFLNSLRMVGASVVAQSGAHLVLSPDLVDASGNSTLTVADGTSSLAVSSLTSVKVTGGILTINGASLDVARSVDAEGGDLKFLGGGTFSLTGQGVLKSLTGHEVVVDGSLTGNTTNADQFTPAGTVTFSGGTSASPRTLEAMSRDVGAVAAGFSRNFAFATLRLATSTYVKLVNSSDNAVGTGAEAVYVDTLVVPAGSTLNLNSLKLYARVYQIDGTVTGGTVTQIPDAGPLAFGLASTGKIANPGEIDEWSFYGIKDTHVTVVLNPGTGTTGSPASIAPQLNWGRVQLIDPTGAVIKDVSDSSAGTLLKLVDVTLGASGLYKVRVSAEAGHPSVTGNYVLTTWDLTPQVRTLGLNQTSSGSLTSPYSVDQWNFSATSGTQVLFDLLNTSANGITFSLTGPNGYSAFTDSSGDSTLITLPSAGQYSLTVHSLSGVTGSYAFNMRQTSVKDLALGGTANGTFGGSGDAQLFHIVVPTNQVLTLQLNDAIVTDDTEMYAQFGTPPTREVYDYRFASPGNNQSIIIPSATPGDWYVLVYAENSTAGTSFSLKATASVTTLTTATPNHAGNGGPVTMTLTGAGFTGSTTVALVAANGTTTYPPTTYSIDSFTQITATFPANIPAGTYSVRATTGNASSSLSNFFTLTAGGAAHLETDLILPGALGRHQTATLYIKYANTGTVAMPAPLLVLSNPNNDRPLMTLDQSLIVQGFWTSAIPDGFSTSISILASGATPGVLQPGESITVPVYYAGLQQPWNFNHNTVPLDLGVINTTDTSSIDWTSLKTNLRPNWIQTTAWDAVFANVIASAGNTSGSYVQMLDNNAQYLGRLGENVTDVGQLWNFSILQANDLAPISTLASATDAAMAAPGLPLSFDRSFGATINSRNQLGAFGLGWSVPWQTSLTQLPDGTVVITSDNGDQYRYQPDGRSPGRYFSATGDMNELTVAANGLFQWKQMNGSVTGFLLNGRLSYVKDTNGNTITAAYDSNSRLKSLTHSSGQSLTITYNAAGLINKITDSAGRQSTYSYDAANKHLMSVTTAAGTTSYTYSVGNGATSENALTSIAYSDGTHRNFSYDALGRLASTFVDGNADKIAYSYDQPGEITSTDLLGNPSQSFYDYRGLLVKSTDALRNSTFVTYDPVTLMVSKIIDPTGQSQTYTYDAMGNVASSTDQLGHKTLYTHGIDNRLTSLTDAYGNKTTYAYDQSGNPLSTTYANGSVESSTFDPLGNPLSFTNRRGQAIAYVYNASGQVTRQTFPDGTHTDFTYDTHGNLKTAVDATGTITFTYDSADRMTRVDYPNGMYLQFTLDVGGRRIKMVDQTNFTVNYTYDAVGRLSVLKDANNVPIVTYTYDVAGQLIRKDNGNGTFTTYAYDADGNVLHLINNAPGGTIVNSRFDYTYNALGQRTKMATLDGTWTYTYDGTGQLTHAIFASTNPAIASQDLLYNYDSVGNRTTTVINGVTTDYVTNNLNEYTSIGGVAQTYDADGNLTGDGISTYTYDSLNRLIKTTTSTTATYAYDALGNRRLTNLNGIVTQFLNDPSGLVNAVAEFDGNGILGAHNTFGLGLEDRNVNGTNYFYDFDIQGNTADVTSTSDVVVNRRSYLPFGPSLYVMVGVVEPFAYEGQSGVQADGNGSFFSRVRYMNGATGRFTSEDPIGKFVPNRESFAQNNPISFSDPSGLLSEIATGVPCYRMNDIYSCSQVTGDSLRAISPGGDGTYVISSRPDDFDLEPQQKAVEQLVYHMSRVNEMAYGFVFSYATVSRLVLLGVNEIQAEFYIAVINPFKTIATSVPDIIVDKQNEIIEIIASAFDPNDLAGPAGFGGLNYVAANQSLPYRVDFENASTATAPAQVVTVTNQLPSTVDWATFQLTEVGWGDTILKVPASSQHFQKTVSMTYNGKTFDVLVEVGIHTSTGIVYAVFQSLDPTTQLPPDVLTGFLPPEPAHLNDPVADLSVPGRGRGQGHISYTVNAKSNLPSGTAIRNVAVITFDQNNSIATNQLSETDPSAGTDANKEALVTLDAGTPTGTVAALPATTTTATFNVHWSGSDDSGGSGVGSYDIYVSDNNSAYTPFLTNTTLTTSAFNGADGHTYRFYAIARDNVGQYDTGAQTAEATTTIQLPIPKVTTPTSTSIKDKSATLGGNVTADGGSPITERGVAYALTSANGNPQLGGIGVTKATVSGTTGVFTVNVSSLAAGASYSFVAYATNINGTTYTSPVSTFTTLAAPQVTTPVATNITDKTATLGGNVTSDGGSSITERGVVYALTSANANPQLGGVGVTKIIANGTIGLFTANVSGLTSGSGYSFVAYATNAIGITYTSPVSTFTTLVLPKVTTPTSTNITDKTATLGGNVTSDGGNPITERGVAYALTSANSNPQIGGVGVTKATASGTTGVFTVNISSLTPGSGYSFVAYATNVNGTTYTSPVSTFATSNAPKVTTPTSANITDQAATLGGNVTSDGGNPITERGVIYALTTTNGNPQIGGVGVTRIAASGTTGVFTANVSNLTPGAGYSFVAYATNGIGTTYTSPVSTFTTLAAATVTTATLTNLSDQTATLGGNVTSDGGSSITERGVVYALTSANVNPQIGGVGVTKVTASGTTGLFTVNVNSLTPNAGYSFVAYATNGVGTTYTSPVKTFTTLAIPLVTPPTLTTPTVTIISDKSAMLGGNVTSDGGGSITERGVVYAMTSTNPNPQIGGVGVTKVTASGSTGAFTVNANGLMNQAVYSFAAYATNSAGTTYTSPASTFEVNLSPVLKGIETSALAYKANDPAFPPLSISSTVAVTDSDSNNLTKMTIQITSGYQNDANGHDLLAFTNGNGITGSFDASTGTLTLSGTAYLGSYREALRSVTFSSSGTNVSTANRTLTMVASDDGSPAPAVSQSITRIVTVSTTNVAPNLSGIDSAPLSYVQGTAAVAVAPAATASDPDSINLASATIQITGNYQAGLDILSAVTTDTGITKSFNGTSGTLTLSGIASLASYQAVLRSVTYNTSSFTGSTVQRTLTFSLNDGISNSNSTTRLLNVVPYIFPPVIGSIESLPLAYKANNPALPISNTVTVSSPVQNNLTKLTVQITSGYQNDANGHDVLSFTNKLGITGSFNAATGTLTLSGTAYLGNYREALRTVTFNSSGTNISTADRIITMIATDDGIPTAGVSVPVTRTVLFNFPPVVTGLEPSRLVYAANSPPLVISNTVGVTDPDSDNLTKLTVQITSGYQNDANGHDLLSFTGKFGITGSFDASTGTLTLTGTAYDGNYREALRTVTYSSTGTSLSTADRILTIIATDDSLPTPAFSKPVTRTISALNLAPVLAGIEPSPLAYVAKGAPLAITNTVTVIDQDSDNLTMLTVQITSGYQNDTNGHDVLAFVNGNGITGSFDAAAGKLTLTGTAYIGVYREALRTVTFSSLGTNVRSGNRILTIIASDDGSPASALSLPITRTVNVTSAP